MYRNITLGCMFCSIMISVYPLVVSSQEARLPQIQNGIASKYPGDQGIDTDPNVIFVENFEEESINAMASRWETASDKQNMSFSDDVPTASGGKQSLLITHTAGQGTGAQLYRRLQPGYKQIFARTYVKFDPECAPIHHFGTHLGGFNPSTPWPQGGAGERPDGAKRFTTGIEPHGSDWQWDFYTYWQGMNVHGDGNYWGTPFLSGVPHPNVELGEWICVEMMVKLNDPVDASNGEQAFWIDGKLWEVDGQIVSHVGNGFPNGNWAGGWWQPDAEADNTFNGFQWRTSEELLINYIWTYVYITKAPRGRVSKVWFDDIVVATEYIGPVQAQNSQLDVEQWEKQ